MENEFMRLNLCTFQVKDIVFGKGSEFSNGVLKIDTNEIKENLRQDIRFKQISIDIAKPGEMTRIIHILDVIEPRAKIGGDLRMFPGFLGSPTTVGSGTTHRLGNVAVMTTGDIQVAKSYGGPSSVAGPRERLVDMGGEAAIFSAFSQTLNVVLNFEPSSDLSMEEYDDAIRKAGLWVSEFLAKLTLNSPPDHVDHLHLGEVNRHLPNVAYIYQILAGDFLRDTYVYGESNRQLIPTIIHPNEIVDGAIVNASSSFASSSTYIHQNNRVIKHLYEAHGKELNFVGVVLTSKHHLTDLDKERKASYAAKLAKLLGANGVVSTQEGGGNSIVDQMLTVKSCEEMGMKTVAITYEMGGIEGTDFPLIYHVKEADALVTTGNREQIVHLPEMRKAVGGTQILYKNISATDSYDTYVSDIAFSIDLTGFWRIGIGEY